MTNGTERKAQDGGLCVQALSGRCVKQRPDSSDREQPARIYSVAVPQNTVLDSMRRGRPLCSALQLAVTLLQPDCAAATPSLGRLARVNQ
jgi:hypothetical protein